MKVVGAFHGLNRERSDARRYPAIHPLDSWSKYPGVVDAEKVAFARGILRRGNEVNQMMKVVGEEGTSIDDFIVYLKGEYLDAAYLQQNSFDDVDGATSADRQEKMFEKILCVLDAKMNFADKDVARRWFLQLTSVTKDWNRVVQDTDEFKQIESRIDKMLSEVSEHA